MVVGIIFTVCFIALVVYVGMKYIDPFLEPHIRAIRHALGNHRYKTISLLLAIAFEMAFLYAVHTASIWLVMFAAFALVILTGKLLLHLAS